MPAATKSRVVVFALGGTIAMTADDTGGVVPALSARQLVSAVPGLAETGLHIEVEDFRRVPGASLTLEDIVTLANGIRDRLANSDVHGVVITQGTDTIEETAYLLDLMYDAPHPLVVTGAMRNPTLAGADGPANLLAAVQVAANQNLRDCGCLVVLADEIHSARRVRKTHTTSGMTFQSPNGGPLGYVIEGQARLINHLDQRLVISVPFREERRVGLVTIVLGDDGVMLEGAADRLDGLVVAAFGVGHVPDRLVPLLESLASRMPVVLASRTGAGSVLTSTYAFPGSERDLLNRGLIAAGFLDSIKARILLTALLASDANRATIIAAFGAAGGYADTRTWPWLSQVQALDLPGAEHA